MFSDCPEFYAAYKLLNVKNHHLYSDRLTLSVVDLSRIDLATDEDKRYHIDYWAKLFKATTWEEIKMLADKDQYIDEASKTIFQLSADEQIRKRCLDREEYYLDMRAYEREVANSKKTIKEQEKALSESKKVIAEKDALIQELLAENERLKESYKAISSPNLNE